VEWQINRFQKLFDASGGGIRMSPESTTKLVYRFFRGIGLIASLLLERVELRSFRQREKLSGCLRAAYCR
jgi:hypothetical protein